MQTLTFGKVITFQYTNHRNVTETRRVMVLGLQYGENSYYPDPQWLLQTIDFGRNNEFRSFALNKIDTATIRIAS